MFMCDMSDGVSSKINVLSSIVFLQNPNPFGEQVHICRARILSFLQLSLYIRKHVYFSFFCLFSSDIQRVCFQGYLSTVYILNGVHFYFYVESFVESHVYTFCFPFIKFSRQNPAIQIKNNLAALYMLKTLIKYRTGDLMFNRALYLFMDIHNSLDRKNTSARNIFLR